MCALDPITTSTGMATIANLVSDWLSQRSARESRDLQQFIDWLQRNRQEQLVHLIQTNNAVAQATRRQLEEHRAEVVAALDRLESLAAERRSTSRERKLAEIMGAVNDFRQARVESGGPGGVRQFEERCDAFFKRIETLFDATEDPLMHQRVKAALVVARRHGREKGVGCVAVNILTCEYLLKSMSSWT